MGPAAKAAGPIFFEGQGGNRNLVFRGDSDSFLQGAAEMPKILNILIRPDEFTKDLIETEKAAGTSEVAVFDLTHPDPDYNELLEEVFRADSVRIW